MINGGEEEEEGESCDDLGISWPYIFFLSNSIRATVKRCWCMFTPQYGNRHQRWNGRLLTPRSDRSCSIPSSIVMRHLTPPQTQAQWVDSAVDRTHAKRTKISNPTSYSLRSLCNSPRPPWTRTGLSVSCSGSWYMVTYICLTPAPVPPLLSFALNANQSLITSSAPRLVSPHRYKAVCGIHTLQHVKATIPPWRTPGRRMFAEREAEKNMYRRRCRLVLGWGGRFDQARARSDNDFGGFTSNAFCHGFVNPVERSG